MTVSRKEILLRCLSGRFPNCGTFTMLRHWFRLRKTCRHCAMPFEQEALGFYFGTTSIGYVIAFLFVIVPVCVLVVLNKLSVGMGIGLGIGCSILLCVALYPFLLCWVLMAYYVLQPQELPIAQTTTQDGDPEKKKSPLL